MQLKWIGALCVIAGCGGLGFTISAQHMKKIHFYKQFLSMLEYMECELQYKATALPNLCRRAGERTQGFLHQVILSFAQELDTQIAPNAYCCMSAALGKLPSVDESYREILIEFSKMLGCFDLSGQLNGLSHIKEVGRDRLEDLLNNKDNRLRSYQALGLCTGAALAILFV